MSFYPVSAYTEHFCGQEKPMRDADYKRAVEAAAKGGARIEVKSGYRPHWVFTEAASWDWINLDYRVAPEEPKLSERDPSYREGYAKGYLDKADADQRITECVVENKFTLCCPQCNTNWEITSTKYPGHAHPIVTMKNTP